MDVLLPLAGEEEERMANEEQMAILKQGVGLWNQWREEHRDILPAHVPHVYLLDS